MVVSLCAFTCNVPSNSDHLFECQNNPEIPFLCLCVCVGSLGFLRQEQNRSSFFFFFSYFQSPDIFFPLTEQTKRNKTEKKIKVILRLPNPEELTISRRTDTCGAGGTFKKAIVV